MKDYLRYLVDEGFVDIRFWYKEDGTIDGRIAAIKEYEPIYVETEEEGNLLLWRTNERVYTYRTTKEFFADYGKYCKTEGQALLQSNKWVRECKELSNTYK